MAASRVAAARRTPRDRRGAQQRHVDRREQERLRLRRQRGDAGLHAGEHAGGEIGVVRARHAEPVISGASASASKPVTT